MPPAKLGSEKADRAIRDIVSWTPEMRQVAKVEPCDYYQAAFEAEEDTDDRDSPYLLIQRQFEDPDDHLCYIETHDEKYCGHFLLRRVDFAPQKLSIKIDRPTDNFVSVTFAMVETEFAEASQVVKIISGEIEPP